MLLENQTNYHLQRSIDTLRSLGDRLNERNVDLRLNLHGDSRNYDNNRNATPSNLQAPPGGQLELNLSLNDRLIQERQLERLINERDHRMDHLERLERSNLERSLIQLDHQRNDDNRTFAIERTLMDRNYGGGSGGGGGENDLADMKYREYKTHLENLRAENRQIENSRVQEEDRGTTPSTPPTPISVGENFQEEKVFGSKAELQLHTQAHMREAKPYKCSQCCKAFANSSYLSQHTRIHLGIKPYRCEICQRKFTQLSHLQQHIRTHTGDKPYKCRHPGCQKAFSQLSNLQSHSRCHQTDKPYKCNSCYKCFSDEPSLLEHIPKHKESKHLKTHICQYCGKSYTQETYLQKHMQKHAERTDKRPPIGPGGAPLNLNHPYWPKISPDSAENMHLTGGNTGGATTANDYPNDISRQLLEQNEDLVIIRQQLSQSNQQQQPTPSITPNLNYDLTSSGVSVSSSSSTSKAQSAFTPINSMSGHFHHHHHHQPHPHPLAPNRPYIYDALNFQTKQNHQLDLVPKSQASAAAAAAAAAAAVTSNGFPNQLISLHQIRNYAHQPSNTASTSLMEHSILGLKDK